ncbi:hypothetical protein, partial [Caballeronia choica]|uniref:hypothetical protein n=1 Tax=Caballeronia choica TaxID=326476 RepID=UPI001F423B07
NKKHKRDRLILPVTNPRKSYRFSLLFSSQIIIEIVLISRWTVLTIRFTELLRDVTGCIKDYLAAQNTAR